MPVVMDAPEQLEHNETDNLTIEWSLAHPQRPGFWYTLLRRLSVSLTPKPYQKYAPLHQSAVHPGETCIDQFVREYPTLSPYAFAIL